MSSLTSTAAFALAHASDVGMKKNN